MQKLTKISPNMVPVPCKIRHNLNLNYLGMHRRDGGGISTCLFWKSDKIQGVPKKSGISDLTFINTSKQSPKGYREFWKDPKVPFGIKL